MQRFTKHAGLVVALRRINVDTDQIIPKQFLKRIERTGFGKFLFYDWRYQEDGVTPRPEFELNLPRYRGASVLVSGTNFGCGSSREHAAWALADFGIKAILAPSFADIFYNNCFKNGLLPVVLQERQVQEIFSRVESCEDYRVTVDLENQRVRDDGSMDFGFEIDPFRRRCLLEGLDEIGLTLQKSDSILAFEQSRRTFR